MADSKSPSAFISYSHDSDDHAGRVLALANVLCDDGIDVILDRYVHPAPEQGWPRWMEQNLDEAKFVLMVCTETYRRRVMGREEPGKGLGVRWEGSLIYNRIYNDKPSGSRFIPILLRPGSEPAHIPNPVQGHTYYRITTFDLTDPGYEALYRHLTDQPATPRPDLGPIQILPSKPRPPIVGGLSRQSRSPLGRRLLGGAIMAALLLAILAMTFGWKPKPFESGTTVPEDTATGSGITGATTTLPPPTPSEKRKRRAGLTVLVNPNVMAIKPNGHGSIVWTLAETNDVGINIESRFAYWKKKDNTIVKTVGRLRTPLRIEPMGRLELRDQVFLYEDAANWAQDGILILDVSFEGSDDNGNDVSGNASLIVNVNYNN